MTLMLNHLIHYRDFIAMQIGTSG